MQPYKHHFIELAMRKGVFLFGEFTLKFGRLSPYFFNSAILNTGEDLLLLGRSYAAALLEAGPSCGLLFSQ